MEAVVIGGWPRVRGGIRARASLRLLSLIAFLSFCLYERRFFILF
jgi:hypothetical protein